MIQKLYELAKYMPQEWISEYENDYGLFMDEKDVKVLVLSFSLSDNTCEYQGMHLEDYSKEKNLSKYYLKNAPGNSKSEFPSIFITRDISLNSKDYNKLTAILKECSEQVEELIPLYKFFEENALTITNDIKEKLHNKDLHILTLLINNQYIGESDLFSPIRDNAKKGLLSSFYTLGNKEYKGKNKTCSLCLSHGKDVGGYDETFKFYATKTDFPPIAGGFKKEKAWKNYPICSDCATNLRNAKPILETKMSYRLYGLNYFILPSFILEDKEDNQEIMNLFLKEEYMGKYSIAKNDIIKITDGSDEIFGMLAQVKNMLSYNLFFYEKNNSEFKILASIDEVFPLQLKKIFVAKEKTEDYDIFKGLLKEKNTLYDMKFNLGVLNEFFPRSSFEKQLLEITRSIFLQKEVSFPYMLNQIMSMIQIKFVNFANNKGILPTTLKSFMLLKFMSYLGIIKQDRKPIKTNKEIIMDEMYQKFFDEHADFFDSNIKKAVFLQGVLCQNLLDIQYKERGATPFRSRLNGLKLNEKIIKRLLPEIITKLEEYDKNYYRKLETTISELYINSDFDLSNDEISYYFTLGMNLNKKIKSNQEEENDSK